MGYDSWTSNNLFTCYHGATPTKPENGMYSYVPCRTGNEASKGFARPVLDVKAFDVFVNGMFKEYISRNVKITKDVTDVILKNVWDKLRSDIHAQGYEEGVMIQYQVKSGVYPAIVIP